MEFILECSIQYLAHSLHSLMRYKGEHKKRNSISTSNHASFCLFYIVFDNFQEILQTLSNGHTFSENSQREPKIAEDLEMF